MNGDKLPENWYRIRIPDPELSYGLALAGFLTGILEMADLRDSTVLLEEVEGGGDPNRGLTGIIANRIGTQELLDRLVFTDQLDWATFCFYKETGASASFFGRRPRIDSISQSALAVRVIDDSFLDIFTQDASLAGKIAELGPRSEIISSLLSEMHFPA